MGLLPVFRKSNGDYERFKEVVYASALFDESESEVNLDDDEAYNVVHTIWVEFALSTSGKDDVLFSFIEYSELIKSKAKGLLYKLTETPSNNSTMGNKLLGVIWQITTMRQNIECFGEGNEYLLWGCFSFVMYDKMEKVCIM